MNGCPYRKHCLGRLPGSWGTHYSSGSLVTSFQGFQQKNVMERGPPANQPHSPSCPSPNQPIKSTAMRPIYPSANQQHSHPVNRPISQSTAQPFCLSPNQPINSTAMRSVYPSANQQHSPSHRTRFHWPAPVLCRAVVSWQPCVSFPPGGCLSEHLTAQF